MTEIIPDTSLVLMRGLIRDQRHWYGFDVLLRREFKSYFRRIVTIDLPSSSSLKECFVDLVDIKKVSDQLVEAMPEGKILVVGVSLGALAALQIRTLYPEKISALVMINSSHPKLASPFERIKVLPAFRILWSRLFGPLAAEKSILRFTINDEVKRAEVSQKMLLSYLDRPWMFKQLFSQLILAMRSIHLPQEVGATTLILSSSEDNLVPASNSRNLAEALFARHIIHKTAGHDLSTEDPDWCLREIKTFLNRQEHLSL